MPNEATFVLLAATALITGGEGSDKYFQALIQQSRIDVMAAEFERKTLTDGQREVAGHLFLISKIVIDRRVTWQISFP